MQNNDIQTPSSSIPTDRIGYQLSAVKSISQETNSLEESGSYKNYGELTMKVCLARKARNE